MPGLRTHAPSLTSPTDALESDGLAMDMWDSTTWTVKQDTAGQGNGQSHTNDSVIQCSPRSWHTSGGLALDIRDIDVGVRTIICRLPFDERAQVLVSESGLEKYI